MFHFQIFASVNGQHFLYTVSILFWLYSINSVLKLNSLKQFKFVSIVSSREDVLDEWWEKEMWNCLRIKGNVGTWCELFIHLWRKKNRGEIFRCLVGKFNKVLVAEYISSSFFPFFFSCLWQYIFKIWL